MDLKSSINGVPVIRSTIAVAKWRLAFGLSLGQNSELLTHAFI
jgi:hypothetical protein